MREFPWGSLQGDIPLIGGWVGQVEVTDNSNEFSGRAPARWLPLRLGPEEARVQGSGGEGKAVVRGVAGGGGADESQGPVEGQGHSAVS
jgi:hypothetical protein